MWAFMFIQDITAQTCRNPSLSYMRYMHLQFQLLWKLSTLYVVCHKIFPEMCTIKSCVAKRENLMLIIFNNKLHTPYLCSYVSRQVGVQLHRRHSPIICNSQLLSSFEDMSQNVTDLLPQGSLNCWNKAFFVPLTKRSADPFVWEHKLHHS